MRARSGLAALLLAGAAAAPACQPVVGTPLPSGPVNVCGTGVKDCSDYSLGATATGPRPDCKSRVFNLLIPQADTQPRCDYGAPTFRYTVVVSVPDSSIYAPGRSFAFLSTQLAAGTTSPTSSLCNLPDCLQLPNLVAGQGRYGVTVDVARMMGLAVNPSGALIPVQARFIPFGPGLGVNTEALDLGLPLADLYTTSRLTQANSAAPLEVTWTAAVAIGSYERIDYPEPPYDAFIPPSVSGLTISEAFTDNFSLGTAADAKADKTITPIDDETGEFRKTTITRRDGLDGWHVWIAQHATQRRISTIKTLSGANDTEVLNTVGFRQAAAPSLVDGVDLVISPPKSYLAVPKLVSPIVNGSAIGFRNVEFPVLPPPVRFAGVVASDSPEGGLLGYPANVAFASTSLLKTTESSVDVADPTLQYATAVDSDNQGRFTTVLPPGIYDVTVSPVEGTGFAKYRTRIDTSAGLSSTLRPPARTLVTGRAILADGRPLSEATVRMRAAAVPLTGTSAVTPRPTLAYTAPDGTFQLEADQGAYVLMVDPQPGTVFPRIVAPLTVTGDTQAIGDVIVPPGARFALTIRDPSDLGNPIAHALVRVYAALPGAGTAAVEIASNTTDTGGYVEISLAPQTR